MCMKFLSVKSSYKPLIEYPLLNACLSLVSLSFCAGEMLLIWALGFAPVYDADKWRHDQEKYEFFLVHFWKLSKQLENNGFAKPCGEDIYRVLCHSFWCDYASRENYASSRQ